MVILGSTGSIGVNALKIAQKFNMPIEALSAYENTELLNEQIKIFKPKFVAIANEKLKHKINHEKVFSGAKGIEDMLSESKSELVVNALVGFAGLKPTILSIKLNKKVALANKESLVVAGSFIDTSKIIPIDSEHFALYYLYSKKAIKKMIITASGGAFRDTPLQKLKYMKACDALKHPNWSMGKKITIDSASMVNKLFELLEAKWLFNAPKYDAVIEPSSLIHGLIEFEDGSTTAHFANANMQLPIAYALLGDVSTNILKSVDLLQMPSIKFRKIDPLRYPIWEIKDKILAKPHLGVVINAANEVAVKQFLEDKINILQLVDIIKTSLVHFEDVHVSCLDDIFDIDLHVRQFAQKG